MLTERSDEQIGVSQKTGRPCPSCGRPWSEDAFYAGCAECKQCKRARSKRNRAVQARRLAAYDRLLSQALAGLNIAPDSTGVTRAIESVTAPQQGEQ